MGRIYLLLALALAGGLFAFLWWFLHTPPERVARFLRRFAILLVAGILIYLAATGRLHWLAALLGAALPFMLRLLRLLQMLPWPLLQRLLSGITGKTPGPKSGQSSEVRTAFLVMTLDHDTGQMDGEVLQGQFRDRRLQDMNREALLRLREECRGDSQSLALLEAYLDRTQPDWREMGAGPSGHHGDGSGDMTPDEACEILGLQPGATREAIVAAHRRLMQKLHPDRGGSDYLAAKINQAKDVLLNNRDNERA